MPGSGTLSTGRKPRECPKDNGEGGREALAPGIGAPPGGVGSGRVRLVAHSLSLTKAPEDKATPNLRRRNKRGGNGACREGGLQLGWQLLRLSKTQT